MSPDSGHPGLQGPQVSTQLSTICVVKQGSNYKLAVNTECGPSDTKLQVYIPVARGAKPAHERGSAGGSPSPH